MMIPESKDLTLTSTYVMNKYMYVIILVYKACLLRPGRSTKSSQPYHN